MDRSEPICVYIIYESEEYETPWTFHRYFKDVSWTELKPQTEEEKEKKGSSYLNDTITEINLPEQAQKSFEKLFNIDDESDITMNKINVSESPPK